MERVISLLAFEDLQDNPYQELINNSQKIKIASQINYEMLNCEESKIGIIEGYF